MEVGRTDAEIVIDAIKDRRMFDYMGPPIFSRWQHEQADAAEALVHRIFTRHPPTREEIAKCLCHSAAVPTNEKAPDPSTGTSEKATDSTSQ